MGKAIQYAVLLVVALALFFIAEPQIFASPKVQVDHVVFDAGSVPQGKEISHEFVLKNVGDQKVTIKPKHC